MENQKNDEYLQGLYYTLEMCDLVIQNRHVFGPNELRKARSLKVETEQRIRMRESIPFDSRS